MEDKIRIGQIVNTHGLKGEVKVYPLTDYPERFSEFQYVFLDGQEEKIRIKNVKYNKNMAILSLDSVTTIEEAEKLRNQYLFISKEDQRELEEDEYLISDLIGFEVLDPNNTKIGILEDILQYAANDVYVVKGTNGQEYLVPGLKIFVPKVDLKEKKIWINPIEGMIE